MSLYLPVRTKGKVAIAICQRCQKKFYYDELVKDPNNGMWVCKADQDVYDPWRLPARQTENIGLNHPRPDTTLDVEGDV